MDLHCDLSSFICTHVMRFMELVNMLFVLGFELHSIFLFTMMPEPVSQGHWWRDLDGVFV